MREPEDDTLDQLASSIGHDLNNMLMVIVTRIDILRRLAKDAEPQRRYLDEMRTAAAKCRELSQQIVAAVRSRKD